jgi:hypothetical protein
MNPVAPVTKIFDTSFTILGNVVLKYKN